MSGRHTAGRRMAGHPKAQRAGGLRLAAIVYIAIVLAGFGASGAQALWKLSGSATSAVAAGTWAPQSIDADNVKCARQDGGLLGTAYADLTLEWPVVDADYYEVSLTGNGMNLKETTNKPSQVFRLPKPGLFGTNKYVVVIKPMAGSGDAARAGQSANISASINFSLLTSVKCSPVK